MNTTLTRADQDVFALLGVAPELLEAARLCRVTDAEARQVWGIRYRDGADLTGIIFPYDDPRTGCRVTARLRRDHPDVKEDGKQQAKYLRPYGDNSHLYFPPGAAELLEDTTVPALFV